MPLSSAYHAISSTAARCDGVTTAMQAFTRPFVTPLATETSQGKVRLVGTGNYIADSEGLKLLTCEHVARQGTMRYCFWGNDSVFEHQEPPPWRMDPLPIDAARTTLSAEAWNAASHKAAAIPVGKFARKHQIAQQAELLFFRGFAGENADYGFGIHQTNGSSYCSQEKADTGDQKFFEIFWEPGEMQFTAVTDAEARSEVKYECPKGLSGSLVWNTRYLQVTSSGTVWTPDHAVVTGLLRRWDKATKTLLVWRVEHLLAWLYPDA
jgi:hypothetical protein